MSSRIRSFRIKGGSGLVIARDGKVIGVLMKRRVHRLGSKFVISVPKTGVRDATDFIVLLIPKNVAPDSEVIGAVVRYLITFRDE